MHPYNLVKVTAKLVSEYLPGSHCSKLHINNSIVLSSYLNTVVLIV